MDYHVRLDLKTEMLTLLRIDQFGYPFITDINVSKTNGKLNDTVQKVPRLIPSLRQWIRLVSMAFSSSLPNLFLCVLKQLRSDINILDAVCQHLFAVFFEVFKANLVIR